MAQGPPNRYVRALRHRDYRRLIVAFLIDSIGSWAAGVVLAVYVFEASGSLPLLAAMASARWIPGLLLAPVAGLVADRYDRRTVMTVSALASGVVAIGQVAVVGLAGPPVLLVLLAVASAVAGAPYRPAAGALTPEVVDERSLAAANGLFAALENLVVVVGPAIGALLLLLQAPVVGVGLNAASFFVAAAISWRLRVRSRGAAEPGESVVRQALAGLGALRDTPTATVLLLFLALDTVLAGAYTVVYIPISEHLGTGSAGYGYLLAAAAVGGIVGAALADRLSAGHRVAPVILGAILVQAVPYALTPLAPNPVVGALLQAVSGTGMVVVDVLAVTAIQREVSAGRLSRVLGLLEMVGLLASVIGSFATSWLLSVLPYGTALVVLGAGVGTVALLCAPLLVRTDRSTAQRAAQLADRVAVLERLELFAAARRPALERLAAAVTIEEIPAGAVLIRQGEPADALWVLVEGRLAVSSTTQRGTIPDVTAPDVVGEIGVLRRSPRTATVTTASPVTLWRLSAADYLDAVGPERVPLLLLGTANIRLHRTEPALARGTTAA